MRLGAIAILMVVGCSSEPARETRTAPDTAATDRPVPIERPVVNYLAVIDTGSEVPPAADEPWWPAAPSASCPFPASACSENCASVTAKLPNEANDCVSPVTVGCVTKGGYWATERTPCFKRVDGAILETYVLSLDELGPDWKGCTGEDRKHVATLETCTR